MAAARRLQADRPETSPGRVKDLSEIQRTAGAFAPCRQHPTTGQLVGGVALRWRHPFRRRSKSHLCSIFLDKADVILSAENLITGCRARQLGWAVKVFFNNTCKRLT